MGHDNTVHRYLCAMFQDNRLPLLCQLKRGRWKRGDFMFFEEGVLGLEEDDRGSTCRERRLSSAETDVCVRDLLFYQRVVLRDVCTYCTEAIICYCMASFVQNEFRCLTSERKIEDWDRQIHGFRDFGTLFIFPRTIGYWYSLEESPKANFCLFYDPKLQPKPFPTLAKPHNQFLISSYILSSFITTPTWRYPPSRRW
jgi:hypothetical protein